LFIFTVLILQIDILDDLQEVAHTAYDRDDDFQQDLSNIFLALKDPHTYAPPVISRLN
jgi:hypothetical protein